MKTNGEALLTEEEREKNIAEVNEALEKAWAALKKYGDPFEGMTTMEVLKKLRSN